MTAPSFLADHLARTPSVSTIPAGAAFLEALARPLSEAYRDDPLGFSDLTIFLPNNRAKRALASLLGELAGEREAAILPRLRTLGDVDEEDLFLSGQPPAAALDLPPPADMTARRLLLARLLREKAKALGRSADWPTALLASDTLGRFLDGLLRDEVPFSALESFSPADMPENAARHWRESLEFLEILGHAWPQVMAANGWMEPAERRAALLGALGETIAGNPDGPPVIVAGALGTARATARFMAKIAQSPRGHVILPGLDLHLDDEGWREIEAPHPQAVFRDWLRLDLGDVERDIVKPWMEDVSEGEARRRFLSLALRPAGATDSWYDGFRDLEAAGTLTEASQGLEVIEAETADEEAALIALLLRRALKEPEQTAMLVTPDRDLARRVCLKLRAWCIEVDDTGGIPLGGTFRGTFLRACAAWLDDPASTVALIQMLNHDLAAWGEDVEMVRRVTRRADYLLRGPKYPDWTDLNDALRERMAESLPAAARLLDGLDDRLTAFRAAGALADKIKILIDLAEWLSTTTEQDGPARLWRYEDGEELAARLEGLLQSDYLPQEEVEGAFAPLFEALLGGGVMRRRGVGHPRLFVYGLVEARLQTADLTILAGLNEGVWPDAAPEDSFLSRGMRSQLGLSAPEMTIGRAAHDFDQHASRPKVVLSRAERQGRAPANPSRWWVRIESFLRAAGLREQVDITETLRDWRGARERPESVEDIKAPLPSPPALVRPTRLRVTEIGRLIRDPYAIYARHILALDAWNLRDAEIGYAERGTAFHLLFQRLGQALKQDPGLDIDSAVESFLPEIFRQSRLPPEQSVLWQRAFQRGLAAYRAYEDTARMEGEPAVVMEEKHSWRMDISGRELEIVGKPDRIDRRVDGTLSIVDYKTGVPPTMKQEGTFDPQLSMLALMTEAGAFPSLGPSRVSRIAYLPMLKGGMTAPVFGDMAGGEDKAGALSSPALDDHLVDIDQRLRTLFAAMLSGERPFPSQIHPMRVGDEGDYDHLARRGEWGVHGGEEAGDGD